MIGQNHSAAAQFEGLIHDFSHTSIHRLTSRNSRFEYTGMTDHIRVGKITDNHIVFAAVQPVEDFFANFIGAHFRLHIIGLNLR